MRSDVIDNLYSPTQCGR